MPGRTYSGRVPRRADAGLAAIVAERYGLRRLPPIVQLTGGYGNDVFRLGQVVVRIAGPRATEAELEYEHRLVERIAARVPEVSAPLHTLDGKTVVAFGRLLGSVWPWIDGRAGARRSATTAATAGALLARIHAAGLEVGPLPSRPGQPSLADLDLRENWMWDVDAALAFRPDPLLEDAWNELGETIELCRGAGLVTGVVHGDYYSRNVIVRRARAVGVIDWDYAKPEWLVWELARSTWEFAKDKRLHDLRPERARLFLEAYRSAGGPVPREEEHLLLPLIRSVRTEEALRHLTDGAYGRLWDARYTAHNLRAIANLRKRADVPLRP